MKTEFLQNVTTIEAESNEYGLSQTAAEALVKILDEFVGMHRNLYENRRGTLIIDAQKTIEKDSLFAQPSYENLTYGTPTRIMYANLPNGKAENIFYDGDRIAEGGIEALLQAKRLFSGHPGATFDCGIYESSGTGAAIYESGHLMIHNTTFGRFLAGCGDDHISSDRRGESDYLFVAISKALVMMFPEDPLLSRGDHWMCRRKDCPVAEYVCDQIGLDIKRIFETSKAEEILAFQHSYAVVTSPNGLMPFMV